MKTFGKSLWLLLLFMTSQISSLLIAFTMIPSQMQGQAYQPNLWLQLLVTLSALLSVYLVWFFAKIIQIPLPKWTKWSLKDTALSLILAAVTTSYARLGLYLLQQMQIHSTANDAALNEIFGGFSFPIFFILIAICGPIMEEWIFRAGIIGFLFEKHALIGVAVSSFIFGAMHMPTNLISWGIYGGMGLIFSMVYYKTKRLELVMAIHILHNIAAIML